MSWFWNLRIVSRLRLPVSLFKWVESLLNTRWCKHENILENSQHFEKILILPKFFRGDKMHPFCVL